MTYKIIEHNQPNNILSTIEKTVLIALIEGHQIQSEGITYKYFQQGSIVYSKENNEEVIDMQAMESGLFQKYETTPENFVYLICATSLSDINNIITRMTEEEKMVTVSERVLTGLNKKDRSHVVS